MGKERKGGEKSPAIHVAKSIKKKYRNKLSPGKPNRARRAILAIENEKVGSPKPGPSCLQQSSLAGNATILLENSVIKGYHSFKIRPPKTVPCTDLLVDKEYTNISDKDACLVWIPDLSTFDSSMHKMVTDDQRNLYLSDVAGLPIGHVPRILASCFQELLDMGATIYAIATGDPVQSFPPWPAPSEKGGGVVIPCTYKIMCKELSNVLESLNKTLSQMAEGKSMNIKVVD